MVHSRSATTRARVRRARGRRASLIHTHIASPSSRVGASSRVARWFVSSLGDSRRFTTRHCGAHPTKRRRAARAAHTRAYGNHARTHGTRRRPRRCVTFTRASSIARARERDVASTGITHQSTTAAGTIDCGGFEKTRERARCDVARRREVVAIEDINIDAIVHARRRRDGTRTRD